MPLVKAVSVKIEVDGVENAKLKIAEVDVVAKKLEKDNPTITPQIETAKALLQARLLREGLKAELSKGLESSSGGGGGFQLSSLFSGGLTSPAAIGAIAAGVATLLPEIAGVVSGLSAATAGMGAFYLLAHPAINNLTQDYAALDTAQNALQLAQNKYAISPTATTLRGLKTAQLNLKAVQMSMGQDAGSAVGQMQKLAAAWGKITNAFQPVAFKVFADGLRVIRDLLPAIVPMATAFGNAIDGLLKRLASFTQSKGFKEWLSQFDKLVGPSVTAIGVGIGKVIIQLGKLLTVMSAHDVVHTLNIAFDILAGTIDAVRIAIKVLLKEWDIFENVILTSVGIIINAAAKAFGWIPGLGPKLKAAAGAFNNWEAGVLSGLGNISGAAASTSAALAAVGYAAVNAFNKAALVPTAGNATPHAAGGPASGMILVGERGPEVLKVPTGSYVYNNQQTQAMMSGSSGGATYNINVRVAPGGEREAGRQIVNAIRAFEQGSGSSWRKH